MYYNQGSEEGTMEFLITCNNAAIGSSVSNSSTQQGPNPLINLPSTTVTKTDFTAGINSKIPAGYTDTLTAQYTCNEPIAEGFSFIFFVEKAETKDIAGSNIGPTPVKLIKQVTTSI